MWSEYFETLAFNSHIKKEYFIKKLYLWTKFVKSFKTQTKILSAWRNEFMKLNQICIFDKCKSFFKIFAFLLKRFTDFILKKSLVEI